MAAGTPGAGPFRHAGLNPAALLLVILGTACAPRQASLPQPDPDPEHEPDPCLIEPVGAPSDTLRIVAPGPLEARAIGQGSPAARLVARHIYETLIRFDCLGRVLHGTAPAVSRDSSGAVWTFRLRSGARLSDGTILDAALVRASWQRQAGGAGWPWSRIREVEVVDPLTLSVRLDTAFATIPVEFGDPRLAIPGEAGRDGWSPGSGRFRVAGVERGPDGFASVTLVPRQGSGPVIRIEVLPFGLDPRDLLEGPRTAGLLITRDPDVAAYAARRADLRVAALAWDRTYVLMTPAPLQDPPAETREALAREVVRASARAARPEGWAVSTRCPAAPSAAGSPRPEIGYQADDPVARSLAERFLALVRSADPPAWLSRWPGPQPIRVVALRPAAMDSGFAAGALAALVRGVPGPWSGCPAGFLAPANAGLIPLVETRAHVIARPDAPPFRIQLDGTISAILPDTT